MTSRKSALATGALVAVMAAGTLAASAAAAENYVVCNRYGDCWKVHQKYTDYPADLRVVYHDDGWWEMHKKNTKHWHWEADQTDDHGWYDKDAVWHPFAPPPAP